MTQPSNSTSSPGSMVPINTNNTEPAYVHGMPDEVMGLVFQCLGLQDIEGCSLVCRSWNALLGLDSFWKNLLQSHYSNRTITFIEGETAQSAYKKLHRFIPNLNHCSYSVSTRENLHQGNGFVETAVSGDKFIVGRNSRRGDGASIQIFESQSLKQIRQFKLPMNLLNIVGGSGKVLLEGSQNIWISDSHSFLGGGETRYQKFPMNHPLFAIDDKNFCYCPHSRNEITVHPVESIGELGITWVFPPLRPGFFNAGCKGKTVCWPP